MVKCIAKYLFKFLLLMFAISLVSFFLVAASPIDPVQANVGQVAYASMSDAQKAQLASYWGSDLNIWQRYFNWLASALHGDFGISLRFNMPVTQVIATRSGNTLMLMLVAWAASGIFGFVLGIAAGVKRGSALDKVVKGYCFILASTPTFWLGLIMLIVFSVWLGWFPFGFSVPIGTSAEDVTFLDSLQHLALPALTLSFVGVANIALHTREKTIDVMESEYIRFARLRGMSSFAALKTHGLRNILLPAVTLQFASVAEIFGGSVLVEQVFSYPGLGQAAVIAGTGGDASLLVCIALVSALIVFCGNALANILYWIIDPRMRMGARKHNGQRNGNSGMSYKGKGQPAAGLYDDTQKRKGLPRKCVGVRKGKGQPHSHNRQPRFSLKDVSQA